MTELNYTKGEWKESQTLTGERLIYAENGDYEIICSNVRHWNKGIIVAAPDMYEVLSTIRTQMDAGVLQIDDARIERDIREALMKAEGK